MHVSAPPPSSLLIDPKVLTFTKHLFTSKSSKTEIAENACPIFSAERDVIFQLFTAKNPNEPQILKLNDITTAKNSNFNRKLPTRMLIHGWQSRGQLEKKFAEAYFVKGQHNINFIVVNWQKGANDFNYYCARQRVNEVGPYVSQFIDFMANQLMTNIGALTIVGHSLGIQHFYEKNSNPLW